MNGLRSMHSKPSTSHDGEAVRGMSIHLSTVFKKLSHDWLSVETGPMLTVMFVDGYNLEILIVLLQVPQASPCTEILTFR